MRVHLLLLLVLSTGLSAIAAEQPAAGANPPSPPAEAVAACQAKKEGDTVSFASPRGDTISGKCKLIAMRLVAVPDQPPPRGGNQPPRQ